MTTIWYLFASVVLSIASSLLMRKNAGIKKANLEDFTVPTATHDRRIPVLFGTCMLRSPNVVWYGGLRSRKVKSGGFLGIGKQTIAYRYFLSWEYILCHGQLDSLSRICVEEDEVWTGTVTGEPGTINVDLPQFFGGSKSGGGIGGEIRFYHGSATQPRDAYLDGEYAAVGLPGVPTRRNLSYVVYEDFEVGYQTRIPPFSYEGTRLAVGPNGDTRSHNGLDANGAYIIYELLTNQTWGAGNALGKIDVDSFDAAAITLENEEFGMSMIWDTPNSVDEMIEEVETHIDGRIYEDPSTGLIKIRLIRQDYDRGTLKRFDLSTIKSFSNFSITGIADLANQVTVRYTNRELKYKPDLVHDQNTANRFAQGRENLITVEYRAIKEESLARRLANRQIKVLGTPLSSGTLETNRLAATVEPGEPFIVTYDPYCLEEVVFRASEIDKGTLKDGNVRMKVVEDIFASPDRIYGDSTAPVWVDPCQEPQEYAKVLSVTAPAFITTGNKAISFVCEEDINQDFDVYTNITGTFIDDTEISGLTPCGTIDAALAEDTAAVTGPIAVTGDLSTLVSANAAQVMTGVNLAYLGDAEGGEWVAFQAVAGAGNSWTLTNFWRGLLDTLPQAHPAGTSIWFAYDGHGLTLTDAADTESYEVKIVPNGICGEIPVDDVVFQQTVNMMARTSRPWPAGQFRISGTSYPTTSVSNSGALLTIPIEWNHRDKDAGVVLRQADLGQTLPPNVEYTLTIHNGPTTADPIINGPNTGITSEIFTWDYVADGILPGTTVTVELFAENVETGLGQLYPLTRTFTV